MEKLFGIFGTMLPLLMNGGDVGTVIRALFGGTGLGASSLDGLMSLRSQQLSMARMSTRHIVNDNTLSRAAEMWVDRLGMNPFTPGGQAAARLMGTLYHMSPSIGSAFLGVPDGTNMFNAMANGASAIGMASGNGVSNVLNPSSVRANHERAIRLARMIYGGHYMGGDGSERYEGLAVRTHGGYDISFGHGLNMDEIGLVSQRLLSSSIPYTDRNGKRLDIESDEFRNNLKNLGSKFNEAVSMLSKITGSVKEALNVMDSMAGGNFLGGTAEQAKDIADRAKRMAAEIRVASAMAGVDAKSTFAHREALNVEIARSMGLSPDVAKRTGFNISTEHMSHLGAMAYASWMATNQDATPFQREQMRLAINTRIESYAGSEAAPLAAAFAKYRHMFTKEQLDQVERDLRGGHTERANRLLYSTIGSEAYNIAMKSDAGMVATRQSAADSAEGRALLDRLDMASLDANGNRQGRVEGTKMAIRAALSGMDETLVMRGIAKGRNLFLERENDVLDELRTMAKTKLGMTDKALANKNIVQLEDMLDASVGPEERQKIENAARVAAAKRQIESMTMDDSEEKAARRRLYMEIDRSGRFNADKKGELMARLQSGKDFDSVLKEYTRGMNVQEVRDVLHVVTRGKMTRGEADRRLAAFSDIDESMRPVSDIDRLAEIAIAVKNRTLSTPEDTKSKLADVKQIGDILGGGVMGDKSDRDRLSELARLMGSVGEFKGGNVELQRFQLSGISEFLKSMGVGLSEKDIEAISGMAVTAFNGQDGGDFGKAIEKAMRSYASDTGYGNINDIADRLAGMGGVGGKVLSKIFGAMHPGEAAGNAYLESISASNGDMAAVAHMMNLLNKKYGNVLGSRPNISKDAADKVSKADDIWAESQMNKISNALRTGDASYLNEALNDTVGRLVSLGGELKKANISSSDVEAAFKDVAWDKTKDPERKGYDEAIANKQAAYNKIKEALGAGDAAEGKLALLENAAKYSFGRTMFLDSAQEEFNKALESRKSREELASVARGAAQKDPLYQLADGVSDLLKLFKGVSNNPAQALSVYVQGGSVEAQAQ